MTDEQFIRIADWCTGKSCKGCEREHNIFEFATDCRFDLLKCALMITKSQKAEIERLQKIIVGFMDEVGTWSNKYEVDISTILKLPLLAKEDFNIRNKIISEAYKEFAERIVKELKSSAIVYTCLINKKQTNHGFLIDDVFCCVDTTYKELTEGGNEPPKNDFKE